MAVVRGRQSRAAPQRQAPAGPRGPAPLAETPEHPILTLQHAVGNQAVQRLLLRQAAAPDGQPIARQWTLGNQSVQRLLRSPTDPTVEASRAPEHARIAAAAAPAAGVLRDRNEPAGGAVGAGTAEEQRSRGAEEQGSGEPSAGAVASAPPLLRSSAPSPARRTSDIVQRADGPMRPPAVTVLPHGQHGAPRRPPAAGPMRPPAAAPAVQRRLGQPAGGPMQAPASGATLQRRIGDGHDLKSARLKGDKVLEACFDNERTLTTGSSGPAVIKLQHALVDLGFRMPKSGIDGSFGQETRAQVKAFQKSAGLKDDGVVGTKTIEALDTQLSTGAGGPGPLPSPPVPAPGKTAPTLAAVVNVGPAAGINGQMNFVINWQLGSNAGPKGGFVIQDVLFTWRTRDKKGKDVPNPDPRSSPLRYFEAWRVAPKSKALTPVNTDTFFWPGAAPWAGNGSKGRVTIAATAHYFDDIKALPAHMIANNPATFAGILQSSLADPALAAAVSGTVAHSLAFHWDSIKVANSPTVLDANTP